MSTLYRKKPVVINAYQWHGMRTGPKSVEFTQWLKKLEHSGREVTWNDDDTLTIHTLEGDYLASVGDYIICGIQRELYPCKPDIFIKTYEEVKDGL